MRTPSSRIQHLVAVEAADDRLVRSGAQAADRNAQVVPKAVSETGGRLSCDVERLHGGDRVERLERCLGSVHRGGHRHVLVNGRESEYEVHRRCPAWTDVGVPSRGPGAIPRVQTIRSWGTLSRSV